MKKDWISQAENLPIGHKTRVDCPQCGEGTNTNAAVINHDAKSYSLYCHACKYNPFKLKGLMSLEDIKKMKELNDAAKSYNQRSIILPEDFTKEIPYEGRLWLYKAGVNESLWRSYNIGYSESMRRVILPVFNTKGSLEWFQCRAVHKGQSPKYIQPSRDRSSILFTSNNREGDRSVVLSEDILSAIVIGQVHKSVSLLGTKITTEQCGILSRTFDRAIVWMDSDSAGKRAAYQIRKALSLTMQVDNIVTEKDPKLLNRDEIKELLHEATT